MSTDADLISRLSTRAKAFVSDPEGVDATHLQTAVEEAISIATEYTITPVLLDIAFYRYLLLVDANGVDEVQLKAYNQALKQITTEPSIDSDGNDIENANAKTRAKTKTNPYL